MAREIYTQAELDAIERQKAKPKPIKCKTPKCPGKMHYHNNVWRESTQDWYEVYGCYRCQQKYVKGDPDK